MQAFMRELSKRMEPDTTVMFGTSAAFTFGVDVKPDKNKNQEVQGATESMGQRIGAMIGYLSANPDKKGILIIGDGDSLMNNQIGEISTAKELGLDLTVIVVDNEAHMAIAAAQARAKNQGILEKSAGTATTRKTHIDFGLIAQGYGADKVVVVDPTDDIKTKLDELFAKDGTPHPTVKVAVVHTAREKPARDVIPFKEGSFVNF